MLVLKQGKEISLDTARDMARAGDEVMVCFYDPDAIVPELPYATVVLHGGGILTQQTVWNMRLAIGHLTKSEQSVEKFFRVKIKIGGGELNGRK